MRLILMFFLIISKFIFAYEILVPEIEMGKDEVLVITLKKADIPGKELIESNKIEDELKLKNLQSKSAKNSVEKSSGKKIEADKSKKERKPKKEEGEKI